MKILFKPYLILFFTLASLCAGAQQYVVLQKKGTARNYKYQVGNDITIQVMRGDLIFSGTITQIADSGIVIDNLIGISIRDIKNVYRPRRFVRVLSKVLLYAGAGYVALDGVNGVINNYSPVISKSTIIASSVMVGTGLLMKPFYTRKFDAQEKYVLKVLDFEKFD